MTRTVQAAKPLEDILEKEWQAQVVQLLKTLGWRHYHVYDSRRSTHGFPDLVCVRNRVVYLELKRERGKLTDEQIDWLRQLRAAGTEAYVARPRDLVALGAALASQHMTEELDATTRAELST